MDTQDYCKFLKLPEPFFNKEELMEELAPGGIVTHNSMSGCHWRNWKDTSLPFNKAAVEWAASLGCTIINAEAFYTAPGRRLEWHTDKADPFVKINFVWGSKNHTMDFAEVKNPVVAKDEAFTSVDSGYFSYRRSELTGITSFTVDKPALLNIGKPHRVTNFDNAGRWCLCMLIWKDNKRLLWNEALELLSEYVLD